MECVLVLCQGVIDPPTPPPLPACLIFDDGCVLWPEVFGDPASGDETNMAALLTNIRTPSRVFITYHGQL